MTAVQPPGFLDALPYNSVHFRRAFGSLVSAPGVVGSGDLRVYANSPTSLTVLVAAGHAWVPSTGGKGLYHVYNDGVVVLNIAAPDPSNPRRDIVVARVNDKSEGTTNFNNWELAVIKGTAAANPSAPAVPARTLLLATVYVAANGISVTSSNITDNRTTASAGLGMAVLTGGARPSNPVNGQMIYDLDAGQVRYWKGNRWAVAAQDKSQAVYLERSSDLEWGFADGFLHSFSAPGSGSSVNESTAAYSASPGTGTTAAAAGYVQITENGHYRIEGTALLDAPGSGYYGALSLTVDTVPPSTLDLRRLAQVDGRQSPTGGLLAFTRAVDVYLTAGARIKLRLATNSSDVTVRNASLYVQRLAG